MVRSVSLLIGIMAASMVTALAIDFTPHESVRELEGSRFSQLLFNDGLWDVTYEPPKRWTYSGEGNVLSLWDPGKEQLDATVVVSKADTAPVVLDPSGMQALRTRARSVLPRGSQEVRLVSEAKDAVTVGGHETYEAAFEYGLFGQKFRTCVIFAFLGDRQMTAQVSSHPDDFAEAYRAFHASLFSFQWHKAS